MSALGKRTFQSPHPTHIPWDPELQADSEHQWQPLPPDGEPSATP